MSLRVIRQSAMPSSRPREPASGTSDLRETTLHVVLPVVTGAAIYLLWRVPTLRVFHWAAALGLEDVVLTFRAFASWSAIRPPSVVLFTAPDGLWVYSLTAAMALLWRREPPSVAKYGWIATALVVALVAELGQAVHLVRGTFDLADVTSCVVAAAVAAGAIGRIRGSAGR